MNISLMLECAVLVFLYMNSMFLIALRLRNNSIVDVGWGFGFVVISVWAFIQSEQTIIQWILLLLVILWGVRLAWYIYSRNKGKGEDYRYAAWRKEWGSSVVLRSYIQVFLLQGVFMLIIASPLYAAFSSAKTSISWNIILGVILFAVGFFFEAIGDAQMKTFKSNVSNQGMIMRHGLWKYTRHPNYFGEALLWWGIGVFSFEVSTWYLSILGPMVITFLLLKVSGVALLERKYDGNDKYADYIRTTNAFLPWCPKKIKETT